MLYNSYNQTSFTKQNKHNQKVGNLESNEFEHW